MKSTGHLHPNEMANWTPKSQDLHSYPTGNLFFPARVVFFASTAKSASSDPKDPNDRNNMLKRTGQPVDDLTLNTSSIVEQTLLKNEGNKLLGEVKDMDLSPDIFKVVEKLAKNNRYLDQELVRKFIKGTVNEDQLKKCAEYLHPDSGDAADRKSMQKLAEHTIFGAIQPHIFDRAVECIEAKSFQHKRAVEEFLDDPKSVKKFAQFMLENPIDHKKAPRDLAGATALDIEQDRMRRSLATFKSREMSTYLQTKADTPEDAEKVKEMIKQFGEESKSHSEHWNELTKSLKHPILENIIADLFPEPIHHDEKDISLTDLQKALKEGQKTHGVDLTLLVTPAMQNEIHRKMVYIQELSRKAAATKTKIENELAAREKEVRKRLEFKQKMEETGRRSGISLTPGTPIRYRKAVESRDGSHTTYEWADTEIEGVFIESHEGSKEEMTIHVEGIGEFGPEEFVNWVRNTQAAQKVTDKATLDKEIEFDILGHPLRVGSVLEQPTVNVDGARGTILRKVEKINDDGTVELDLYIPVASAGDVADDVPLATPIQKKKVTFGEFAQWVKRTHAKPYMENPQQAEAAYNKWKKAKGSPSDVRFQKGTFLRCGPYEQNNLLLIQDVTTDPATGEQFVTINGVKYRAGEILDNAMAAHWEPLNEEEYAKEATAHIDNPMQRIEVYNRTIEKIRRQKMHVATRYNDKEMVASLAALGTAATTATRGAVASASAAHAPAVAAHYAAPHGKVTVKTDDPHHKGGHGGGGGGHGGGSDGPKGPGGPENTSHHEKAHEEKENKHINPSSPSNTETFIPNLTTEIPKSNPEKERAEEEEKEAKRKMIEKNVYTPDSNALRDLWVDTHCLSVQEMWQLGKHVWEYWERTWERKMKGRFSKFGQHLPFIGTEMLRIKEETEHHEVGVFKEAITAMGVIEIRGILNRSSNADQIKACIEVLVEKGQMRWDDVRTWEAMNRIPNIPANKKIPIPNDRNPYTPVGIDEKTGANVMGMDHFGQAIDALWGDALYEKWTNSSGSAYDSGMSGFNKQGEELESDPYGTGKIAGRLRNILKRHIEGEWANPQEYEGFIRYIIDNGKSTAENKIFFIVAGIATRLIPLERLGAIADKLQNKLPFLAFLADKGSKKPFQNAPGPYTVDQLKQLTEEFMSDPGITKKEQQYTAGPKVKDFLWKYALTNGETQTRTIKAIRNGESNIDHDDAHMVIPLLDEEWVTQVCSHSGGRKKYFTIPGYLNAFVGFSEWVKTLSGTYDPAHPEDFRTNKVKLVQAIKAFVKYNGILCKRFKKGDENYQRVARDYLDQGSVVDSHPVRKHKEQMEGVVTALGNAFGIDDTKYLTMDTPEDFKDVPNEAKKQKAIETAHERFGRLLQDAIEDDPKGVEKMIRIIQGQKLWGYGYNADMKVQEKAKAGSASLEAAASEAEADAARKKFGH